jgi:hypothetical protein
MHSMFMYIIITHSGIFFCFFPPFYFSFPTRCKPFIRCRVLTSTLRLLNAHNSWPITLSPVSKTNNRDTIQINVYAFETEDTGFVLL